MKQNQLNPNTMDAKEYYDKERLAGNTYDITSNENPNYHLSFYQNIFRLMESFHTEKSKEDARERHKSAREMITHLASVKRGSKMILEIHIDDINNALRIASGLDNLKD